MWKIPLFQLHIGPEEKQAVMGVLDSAWLTMGTEIQSFEAEFAQGLGLSPAQSVAVANCTVGLQLAYRACDIGPGDEVIVPSLTFVATANAVVECGGTPVFADVESALEPTLSVADVERKITSRTKAVAVVHYGGWAGRVRELAELCRARGLKLIEDVAHAPWGRLGGQALGTFGDIGCFSFFSNKNMTCGEGGLVAARDEALAKRLRALRSHGMTTSTLDRHRGHAFSYDVAEPGTNDRMDEMRAALARAQLRKLPGFLAERRRVFAAFREALPALGVHVCFEGRSADEVAETSIHILPVVLPAGVKREAVMAGLKEHGVQTSFHYPPIHLFSAYRDRPGCGLGTLPVTESLVDGIVTLPFYPGLSADDIAYVVDSLGKVLKTAEA